MILRKYLSVNGQPFEISSHVFLLIINCCSSIWKSVWCWIISSFVHQLWYPIQQLLSKDIYFISNLCSSFITILIFVITIWTDNFCFIFEEILHSSFHVSMTQFDVYCLHVRFCVNFFIEMLLKIWYYETASVQKWNSTEKIWVYKSLPSLHPRGTFFGPFPLIILVLILKVRYFLNRNYFTKDKS